MKFTLAKLNLNLVFYSEEPKLTTLWRPKVGGFMVKGTPGEPYLVDIAALAKVEENMRYRRQEVTRLLPKNEYILSFTAFLRYNSVPLGDSIELATEQ